MTFMSPELMIPSKFSFKDSLPTPESDIYAFGLVVFQVCEQDLEYLPSAYIVQVLTGEQPFRGVRMGELSFNVVAGVRPTKPKNASAIGLSDLLWGFIQRCWDGDLKLRPKVAEVVAQLERAAAGWDGVIPPLVDADDVVSASKEPMSDSMLHYGHVNFACPSRKSAGGISQLSSNIISASKEPMLDSIKHSEFEIFIL